MNRHVLVAIVITLCLTVLTGSARAAYEVYMTVNGAKQGRFSGDSPGGDSNRIPCLKFSYQGNRPGVIATGQASGSRRHEEIVVTKEIDRASPALFRALSTHEVLREVRFEFVRAAPGKGEQVYKTLRLTNAEVTSIRRFANTGANGRELEEVTLTFERENLEAGGADGQPLPLEHWIAIPK